MAFRVLAVADRALTWKRARTYALVLIALYLVAWISVLVQGQPPLNSSGTPIGGDYIAFHAAGRLILAGQGASLYDHAAVTRVQQELLGGRIPNFYDAYRNPPFFALVFAPFASLDLLPGFAVWSLMSVGCLAAAVLLLVGAVPAWRPRWRGLFVLVLAFAPVYFGLINGQNATVSLLLYVLLYRALKGGNWALAGLWAALGLFKPQLFFIWPLIFIASRQWRALGVYALTSLALATVSVGMVGVDGMQAWLRVLLEPEVSNAAVNAWRMVSLKAFLDILLPDSATIAWVVYVVLAAPILALTLRAWSRRSLLLGVLWPTTVLVAVLVDPHLVDYDLTILVAAATIASWQATRAVVWVTCALYFITLLRIQVSIPATPAAISFGPVAIGALALLLARRSHCSGRTCVGELRGNV